MKSKRELENNDLTKSEIFYASMLKQTLIKHNFTVQETGKIPKLLHEIEECKGNPNIFLERAEKSATLTRENYFLLKRKERQETDVKDLKDQKTLLEEDVKNLAEKKTELEDNNRKVQENLYALEAEYRKKDDYLNIVNCINNILLSKPADVNNLYMYAQTLKEITDKPDPRFVHFKPAYTEEVRKILVRVFTEHFNKDLAPKEELIKLQYELHDKRQKNETLTRQNQTLKQQNEACAKETKKLQKEVQNLREELRKIDESKLADPTIHYED